MQFILWNCIFSEFRKFQSEWVYVVLVRHAIFMASSTSLSWLYKELCQNKTTKMHCFHCFLHCRWIFFFSSFQCAMLILFSFLFSLHFPSSCAFPDLSFLLCFSFCFILFFYIIMAACVSGSAHVFFSFYLIFVTR